MFRFRREELEEIEVRSAFEAAQNSVLVAEYVLYSAQNSSPANKYLYPAYNLNPNIICTCIAPENNIRSPLSRSSP